jgi:hypothetical protein
MVSEAKLEAKRGNVHERRFYTQRLARRIIEQFTAKDTKAACAAVFEIIERPTANVTVKADAHRQGAEFNVTLAAERLLSDDSPEGERLRWYELTSGQGVIRSQDNLHKQQRALSVVQCPLIIARLKRSMSQMRRTNPTSLGKTRRTNPPSLGKTRRTNPTSLGKTRRTNPTSLGKTRRTNPTSLGKTRRTNPTSLGKTCRTNPTGLAACCKAGESQTPLLT